MTGFTSTIRNEKNIQGQGPNGGAGLAFSADGSLLAVGESNGLLSLWDVQATRRRWQITLPGSVTVWDLSISPDGQSIAATTPVLGAWIGKLDSGELVSQCGGYVSIDGVAWSPDGTLLAMVGVQGVSVWEPISKACRWTHEFYGMDVAWSPDGQYLAVLGKTDIAIFEATTGACWQSGEIPGADLRTIQWSPGGQTVAFGVNHSICLWSPFEKSSPWASTIPLSQQFAADTPLPDLAGNLATFSSQPHQSPVQCVAWSPDGKWFLSGDSGEPNQSGQICIWDMANGTVSASLPIKENIRRLQWSPQGTGFVSAHANSLFRMWS